MNRRWLLAGGSFTVILALAVVWFRPFAEKEKQQESRLVHHISYTLAVTNKSPALIENVDFAVLGPNSHTRSQRCERIDADREFSTSTDDLNNQILHFSFADLHPFAVKMVNIRADVTMQASSSALLANRGNYLASQPQLHLDNARLRKQAGKLLGKDDLQTVTNSYSWITGTISKTGYSEKDRGALYALHKKSGDCTEFMHLFVALCRINGIPARGVSGYIVSRNKHLSPDEFHDWAEVYIGEKWYLVDPFNKVFMEKEEFYVVMRIHGDRPDGGFFHRWFTDDERLHIAMAN